MRKPGSVTEMRAREREREREIDLQETSREGPGHNKESSLVVSSDVISLRAGSFKEQ